MPAPIVIPAKEKHTATLIMVHGLGDSGQGWVSFAIAAAQKFPHVKFVLPTAPSRVVTVAGQHMNAWFDVKAFHNTDPLMEDQAGILESVAGIEELVMAEVKAGIPSNRVVVGGFSQGCVLSLIYGLTTEQEIAGILGLSGMLAMSERIASLQQPQSSKLPFFWGHGTNDNIIRYSKAEVGVAQLKELGVDLEFHAYPGMEHSTGPQEMVDIEAFLRRVIP